MPFASNSDLPESVRGVLPDSAQSVFRSVVNSQLERGLSEERAFASAWSALKNQGWKKGDDDKWHKVQKNLVSISGACVDDVTGMIKKQVELYDPVYGTSPCEFCDCPSVKAMLWAGGSQHMFVCADHIETGLRQIVDNNRDAVNQVIDLVAPAMGEDSVAEDDITEIKITIWKAENMEEVDITKECPILKRDEEKRLVTGVVLEPEIEDAHGDIISEADVEEAAHDFMRKSRVIGLQHKELGPVEVVESFIAKEAMKIGDEQVAKGAWVMTVKVHDEDVWKAVKSGEFTGFSIGGTGMRG